MLSEHDNGAQDVVFSTSDLSVVSPTLDQYQSWSYTFNQTGTFSYTFKLHPQKTGEITVAAVPLDSFALNERRTVQDEQGIGPAVHDVDLAVCLVIGYSYGFHGPHEDVQHGIIFPVHYEKRSEILEAPAGNINLLLTGFTATPLHWIANALTLVLATIWFVVPFIETSCCVVT